MNEEKMEVLKTSYEYNQRLIPAVKKTVTLFNEDKGTEALNMLRQISEGLGWLIEAITLTPDIQKSQIDTSFINEHLNEMLNAIENMDFILLADLLEYEILPTLQNWDRVLAESIQ